MADNRPPDINDDDMRRMFNDIARTELAAPRPECECKCNGVEPHADRLCHRPATTLVALHRVGWCTSPANAGGTVHPENVDAEGNLTSLMCDRCADWAVAVTKRKINDLYEQWRASGGAPGDVARCPTCQRDMARWSDICTRRPM